MPMAVIGHHGVFCGVERYGSKGCVWGAPTSGNLVLIRDWYCYIGTRNRATLSRLEGRASCVTGDIIKGFLHARHAFQPFEPSHLFFHASGPHSLENGYFLDLGHWTVS